MAGLYEISDSQWQLIEDIVSSAQSMGRPRKTTERCQTKSFNFSALVPSGLAFPNVIALGVLPTLGSDNGVMTAPFRQFRSVSNFGFAKMACWISKPK